MKWYGAHVVLRTEFLDQKQGDPLHVMENVYLVNATDEEEAWAKAEVLGKDEAAVGGYSYDGKPSRWVFAGVRKIVSVSDGSDLANGMEVTYDQFEFENHDELQKFLDGTKDVKALIWGTKIEG